MAQARLWLWGLIPLALMWLLAIWIETGPVQKDVGTRTGEALKSGAWVPSEITAQGRDVIFAGEAYEAGDRAAAVATADVVRGVRRVDDQSHLVPEAKPYVWSATKDIAAIAMSGKVPKPQTRDDLLQKARAAGGTATDTTSFARGAPAGFDSAAALGLTQLAALTHGKVSLTDGSLSISGVAKDRTARDAIITALKTLPPGFTLGESSVSVPTYDFTAINDAAAGTLTFEGALPDDGTRSKLVSLAQGAFPGEKVLDNTKIQSGAPPGFGDAAATGLQQLSRLNGGTLRLSDNAVALSGGALYARAVDQIHDVLKALPSGFAGKADLKAEPPAASVDAAGCQTLFAHQLAKGKILFETASAKIDKTSAGLLDHLVAIDLRCPSLAVEVSGHTDASGSDQTNMDLSKRRAQAVVDYLVAAGLDAAHLTSVGYGKTRPIAPNDTEEGMAKNRRIEFLVK